MKITNFICSANYSVHIGYMKTNDDCKTGLKKTLCQKETKNGELTPVAVVSRSLYNSKKRYATGELETLRVVQALEHFRYDN